ncbi:MAG: amino acid permease [Segniliparus sp.]|uniref:amino acid permease n=1 Tax=Segniliparus sp. TaxID=2804064 RepID=UPI003F337C37
MASVIERSAADADDLVALGYQPQLHRSLGKFASFAAGFSFVSILTTIFQLFGFGFGFAGPAFFWAWPVVFLGQYMVALNFAELAARYPISGAVFHWSRRLGGAAVGWFAGWFMIVAQIVTASAAAIALQVVLPSVWRGFQIVGSDPSLTSMSGASNAVLLGAVLVAATTAINAVGVSWMSAVNSIGVSCEIVGVVAVVGMLFWHAERGPQAVLSTGAVPHAGYAGAFVVSGLMAAYVMVGFGSASELAEETRNPRKVAPRTIRSAIVVSAIGGGLMILAALMAAPSLVDGKLASAGLPYVLDSKLGSPFGKLLLVDVAIAIFVCTLAIQTSAARLVFSMARDGKLPFARVLASVNARTGTPIAPAVVVGFCCVLVLAVNFGNAALFTSLCSVCIALIYLAYLFVTAPLLLNRLGWRGKSWDSNRGQFDTDGAPLFSLGRWGLPVNALAVLYGALMVVNLAWPRTEVFDPTGEQPLLRWIAPAAIALVLAAGAVLYPRRGESAAEAAAPQPFAAAAK